MNKDADNMNEMAENPEGFSADSFEEETQLSEDSLLTMDEENLFDILGGLGDKGAPNEEGEGELDPFDSDNSTMTFGYDDSDDDDDDWAFDDGETDSEDDPDDSDEDTDSDGEYDEEEDQDDETLESEDSGMYNDSEEDSDEDSEEEVSNKTNLTKDERAEFEKVFGKFKANGVDVKVNTADEAIALMQKGLNYEAKMRSIKDHRRTLSTLKEHGIGEQELNLLIAAKQGNKTALSQLLKASNVTPYDLDSDEVEEGVIDNYLPSQEEVDAKVAFEEAVESLEDRGVRVPVMELTQTWDNESLSQLYRNPNLLIDMGNLIESGHFNTIASEAAKFKALYGNQGRTDLQIFAGVYQNMFMNSDNQEATGTPSNRTQDQPEGKKKMKTQNAGSASKANRKELSRRRKSAQPTRKTSSSPRSTGKTAKSGISVDRIASMSDREFMEFNEKFGDRIFEFGNPIQSPD